MRITTRIALGSGVVIVLLAGVTAYEAGTIARLAALQRALGEDTLPATALALDLLGTRDRLEEHLLKFAATGDRRYAAAAAEAIVEVGRGLDRIRDLRPTGDERQAILDLTRRWRAFPMASSSGPELVEALGGPDRREVVARFSRPLDELHADLLTVVAVAREQTEHRVAAAGEAAVRARRLALSALVVSVALAGAVTAFTISSIQRRLARLVAATEAIAGGRFDHRVPTEGDDELSHLAAHFNSMAERLGELDRLKRDFLSNVSHELKTPLAAIAETSQLLLDEVPGPLTAKQRRFVELQLEGNTRLQEMVRDLLDLSRLEAGVMDYTFEAVAAGPILATAVRQLEALALERDVRVELEVRRGMPQVRCDPKRLQQVVVNLLGNAIRFSPEGGRVTVAAGEVRVGERDWVRLTVRDQGPGVPDDEKPRVFERFYRGGGPRPRDRAGVGLGLAICREIVAAHGGRILVEDAPGGGSLFVVDLGLATDRTPGGQGQEETA